jgi:hypothetical protein
MAPLPYYEWPEVATGTDRTWTVKKLPDALDVGHLDTLTISFNAAGTKIKVKSITCTTHSPAHDAKEWVDMECNVMALNKVGGKNFSGDDFEIESSEVVEAGNRHNKLTCTVINPDKSGRPTRDNLDVDPLQRTAGSVCWTAEDG